MRTESPYQNIYRSMINYPLKWSHLVCFLCFCVIPAAHTLSGICRQPPAQLMTGKSMGRLFFYLSYFYWETSRFVCFLLNYWLWTCVALIMGNPPTELIMIILLWGLINNCCFAHFGRRTIIGLLHCSTKEQHSSESDFPQYFYLITGLWL